jgi:ribose transport system substrate-binding protein
MRSKLQSGGTRGRRSGTLAAGALLGVAALTCTAAAPSYAADDGFHGPTQPAKAPKGIKVGIVSCAAALKGCQLQADSAAEAAKAVGWEVAMFDGKVNPKVQASAMLDALSWGANVIIAASIDYRSIQLPLNEAKKAGVAVVALGQGGDTPNPLPVLAPGQLGWTFAVDVDNLALGHAIGEWIVKDSGGKANLVAFDDKEYDSVDTQHKGVMEALAKCGGCKVTEQFFAASQIATNLGQQVVGFLRSHPDVDYVYAPYDPSAFAMVAAIRQAGMSSKVKLASLLGDAENLDLIRRGDTQVADVAFDLHYSGYAAIDQIIRYLNKQPLFEPHGENVPYEVLDKTNLPASGDWMSHSGYKEKFLALWK